VAKQAKSRRLVAVIAGDRGLEKVNSERSKNMNQLRGTVHGKVIELSEETGLPDGQEVTVVVNPVPLKCEDELPLPGDGLRRSAGAWAEDAAELENYLEWNRQQRKLGRRETRP
jgi:hypothetical protein